MATRNKPPRYGSYLLRYWEVRSNLRGKPSCWRFSLEEAGTGQRYAFNSLEAVLAHLAQALAAEGAGATGQENQHE